jgi:DNA-binding winged helix-turn-helix (wHTH) protein/tetratricopeptide (TPR) repeat protein
MLRLREVGKMPSPDRALRYVFGPYELDIAKGRLRKYGVRMRLERKPLQLLLALLERPGVLVTRNELRRRLWGEDVFVDFENGVNVAVKKLRTALGDSAEAPVYVETIAGEGYRFVGTVEAVLAGADHEEVQSAEIEFIPIPKNDPVAPLVQQPGGRFWPRAALAIAVVLCVAGIAAFYPRPSAARLPSSATVLIGPFENTTGEPVLDGTLRFALERELSNSQSVRVVPPERVQDILKLMRRTPPDQLDRTVALEICRRTPEIRALITGRVDKIGSKYLLTAQLIDPRSGATLRGEEAQSDSQNAILPAVHGLAAQVGQDIGAAVSAPDSGSGAVEQVTTSSLRALQLYSEADDLMIVNGPGGQDIVDLLEQALAEDPDFATAHVMLGYVLSNMGHPKEGMPHFERAMALADKVSEHERLFILGSYYEVHGDIPRKTAAYEELLRHYPDDMWALRNLADAYGDAGRDRDALRLVFHRAMLRPETEDMPFADIWNQLMAAGEVDNANQLADRCRQHPQTGPCEALLIQVAAQPIWQQLRAGHPEEALRIGRQLGQRSSQLRPAARDVLNDTLCGLYMDLGMLEEANQLLLNLDKPDYDYGEAMIAHARGDLTAESAYLTPVLRNPDWVGPGTFMRLIEVNRIPEARLVLAHKEKADKASGLVRLARGSIRSAEGDPAGSLPDLRRAMDDLQKHVHIAYVSAADHMATALEQSGDINGAITALVDLQEELPALGNNFVVHFYNLDARWHLAQLYRKTGQVDKAEKIENGLRIQLKLADPDVAIVRGLKELSGSDMQAAVQR